MKPFDLQAALAGAPVVTKTGRKVQGISYFPYANLICNRVYAVLEGITGNNVQSYDEFGHVGGGAFDLFMAPTKVTRYYNVWDSPGHHYTFYDTREAALADNKGLSRTSKGVGGWKKLNPEPFEITTEED